MKGGNPGHHRPPLCRSAHTLIAPVPPVDRGGSQRPPWGQSFRMPPHVMTSGTPPPKKIPPLTHPVTNATYTPKKCDHGNQKTENNRSYSRREHQHRSGKRGVFLFHPGSAAHHLLAPPQRPPARSFHWLTSGKKVR